MKVGSLRRYVCILLVISLGLPSANQLRAADEPVISGEAVEFTLPDELHETRQNTINDFILAKNLAHSELDHFTDHLSEELSNSASQEASTGPFSDLSEKEKALQVAREILLLIHRLTEKMDEKQHELVKKFGAMDAVKIWKDEINQGFVKAEIPGVGTAQLNTVEGKRFVLIKHQPTEISFSFIDESTPQESRHLKQIVARQLLEAGKSRTDGQKGRDSAVIRVSSSQTQDQPQNHTPPTVENIQFKERPTGIKDTTVQWYYANIETVNWKKATVQGLIFGGLQFVCAWQASALSAYFSGSEMTMIPAILSFIFGGVIAAFNSTYRHIMYKGGKRSMFVKSMGLSLLFAFILRMWMARSFNPASLGILPVAAILANGTISNLMRVESMIIPKMRNLPPLRISARDRSFFRGKIKMSQATVEAQLAYLTNFMIKLPGVLPGTEVIGNLIFLVASEVWKWINLKYAEKIQYPGSLHGELRSAREMRQEWEGRPWVKAFRSIRPQPCQKLFAGT